MQQQLLDSFPTYSNYFWVATGFNTGRVAAVRKTYRPSHYNLRTHVALAGLSSRCEVVLTERQAKQVEQINRHWETSHKSC